MAALTYWGGQKGSTVYNEAAIRALRDTLDAEDETSLRFYVINFGDYVKIQHPIDEQEPILLENVRFIPVDYTDYLEFMTAYYEFLDKVGSGEIYFEEDDEIGAFTYLFKNYLPKYLGGKSLTAIDLLDSYTKPFGIKTVDVERDSNTMTESERGVSVVYDEVLRNAYKTTSSSLNYFVQTSTVLLPPTFQNVSLPFNIKKEFSDDSGFTFTPEGNYYFYYLPND